MEKPFRPEINVLQIPDTITKYLGLNPKYNFKFREIFLGINCSSIALFWILSLMNLFFVYEDLRELSAALEAITILIHGTGKIIAFLTNQNVIFSMYQNTQQFWKIDMFGPKIQAECTTVLRLGNLVIKLLLIGGHLVMVLFFTKSIVLWNGELPLVCYVPSGWQGIVVTILQIFTDIFIVESMISFDFMFIGFGCEILSQLKLLTHAFKSINLNNIHSREELNHFNYTLRRYIEHHALILQYCTDLSQILTFSFFAQYALCTFTTCFELYMILESDDITWPDIVRGAVYVTTISLELSNYCVMCGLISTQIEKLSNAVYSCPWYGNNFFKAQKSLGFVILRNIKQKPFKAGGFLSVNMETFINIFKTAFSFFTFMKHIKELN